MRILITKKTFEIHDGKIMEIFCFIKKINLMDFTFFCLLFLNFILINLVKIEYFETFY